ncbi:glycosyltransferase [Paracoccus sp. (in: a-proteobacteria)]|uniref:glycosyltransferase n=1 Tax=Paracoccus sp. TaxID=267 RepID=UPI0026E0018C|nr:glycosyltransferase [Paracoccus sp. (in: a-proteobacteria)]MDO5646986.1 glycosyltransferase [Paracoccus sp. (in: a-proteobacteria)]
MILLAGVLLAVHLVTIAIVLWRMSRPVRRETDMPQVTLIRPVCGLDYGIEQTLASGFAQDAPGYRLIHCVQRDDDPALPLLRRLMAAHPGVDAHLTGPEQVITGNPKLNNLASGWPLVAGEWVVMADSNLLLPPDYLRVVMARRGRGMVSSPACGTNPATFWARVEAGFLNTYQARWQLAGDSLGNGFAQGKTLAYPLDWLNAQGGLPALGHDLAEDVASTKLTRADGGRVRLTPRPFAQPLGPRSRAQVLGRQIRWARLRRAGFPMIFASEALTTPALPLLLLAGAWPAAIPAFLALWYGAEWLLARRAGWPAGAVDLAAWVTRDALLWPIWAAGWRQGGALTWRGNAVTDAKDA